MAFENQRLSTAGSGDDAPKSRSSSSIRVRTWARSAQALWRLGSWVGHGFQGVPPRHLKWRLLRDLSIRESGWIETGTYRGDTTAFLAGISPKVVSIEADQVLAARAAHRFSSNARVSVVTGDSADVLSDVLRTWSGSANFWLDGHYSGPGTYEGATPCPLTSELAAIGEFVDSGARVAIFIDDARCLRGGLEEQNGYPGLDDIARWAVAHGLLVAVVHDVVVARSAES